jgi:hypothetical protein
MMTGGVVNYIPAGVIPRQVSIGWNESLYNVDAAISLYNGTNGVGPLFNIFAPLGPTIPVGPSASWGDAAGPYRPFLDFGDAPASYDPDPWSPACHDTLTPTVSGTRRKMRLGPDEDVEWLKKGLTSVEDTYEDGLAFVPLFSPSAGSYQAQVSVFNNTGSNAIMRGWLDYDGNGVFDPGESSTPVTVASSGVAQMIWLDWPSTPSSLLPGSFTYLRIRITSAAYSMTASDATGYYDMGEVEDYRVFVDDGVLAVPLISFDVAPENNSRVNLSWFIQEEAGCLGYAIERSRNAIAWEQAGFVPARGAGLQRYQAYDLSPYAGKSFYRLKMVYASDASGYSEIRPVRISGISGRIGLYPNPATDRASLTITSVSQQQVAISITNAAGIHLHSFSPVINSGPNTIGLPIQPSWPPGLYVVRIDTGDEVINKKLIITK